MQFQPAIFLSDRAIEIHSCNAVIIVVFGSQFNDCMEEPLCDTHEAEDTSLISIRNTQICDFLPLNIHDPVEDKMNGLAKGSSSLEYVNVIQARMKSLNVYLWHRTKKQIEMSPKGV